MSWDFCETTEQVARKEYHCGASDYVTEMTDMLEEEFTPEEWQQIKKAQSENWKILKGSTYTKTAGKWDGDFCVFRARPELNAICLKYDLYRE